MRRELGEPPDRGARQLQVHLERRVRRGRRRVQAGAHVERVEDVGGQRDPVALAEQGDLPGRVAGQQHRAEAGHVVALLDGAGDRDRPAVPQLEQHRVDRTGVRRQQLELHVAEPAVALGLLALQRMAEDRRAAELVRRAAVVDVRVPEHDAVDPAEPARGGDDRAAHPAHAGVEDRDPAARVGDQVGVHPPRDAAADAPHAVGDRLRGGAGEPPRAARLRVERAEHGGVGARALRRHEAELAREPEAVGERVVVHDQPVAHPQQVQAAQRHVLPRRRDALERARARERAGGAPAHRHAVVLRRDGLDAEREVGDRGEQVAEEGADAVRAVDARLADHVVDPVGRPARHRGVHVARRQGVEVRRHHGPCVSGHGRDDTVPRRAQAHATDGGRARRAGAPRRLAAARPAALARRAARQRLGGRRPATASCCSTAASAAAGRCATSSARWSRPAGRSRTSA